jgi:hypothetical protein
MPSGCKIVIKKMPDRKTLEAFIEGSFSPEPGEVYFDLEKGEFVWNEELRSISNNTGQK